MESPEKIKQEILNKTKEYFDIAFRRNDSFIPGTSRINYAEKVFDENELINLIDSTLEFWLTHGKYSKEFEDEFARFLGVKKSLLVNSGSSANLLAFMALTSPLLGEKRISRGDEVITVAACFPTTITPIIQYGAVPVFVDVDLETHNIDVSYLDQCLSEKTRAVILAHTLGNPFNIKEVKAFCERHNLWLIEDNCDALGAKYQGKLTGTWGDIGTSSFYPPHHMTMGEGGAVYTNDELLHKIMLSMRDWGRDCCCESGEDGRCGSRFSRQYGELPIGYDHKYVYSHFGYNLKASDMQAAIGCAQLKKLPQFVDDRKKNFSYLLNGLKDFESYFLLPKATINSDPSWFGFMLTIKEGVSFTRNEIVNFLEQRNIQTRNLFSGNIIMHPCFSTMVENEDYRVLGSLENTNKIMNDSFWIGVAPTMTQEKLQYMVDSISCFVNKS
ncbi:MAG: lipopolysaccharide biosynthesis protein RfbH [Gammaproteobacteria bacterium]|nr:MAG: lipopolysaccharide biosynthesis protein RfbH [Gammaproteobacteria bacterium]